MALSDDKDGYKKVTLCKNNTTKKISVHRLVCHHFVENINKGDIVNHKDGIKYNNLYTNLEKCTVRYNCRHYIEVICNKENVGIRQLPSGNWQARKNHLSIGTFKTKEEAQKAYDDSFELTEEKKGVIIEEVVGGEDELLQRSRARVNSGK